MRVESGDSVPGCAFSLNFRPPVNTLASPFARRLEGQRGSAAQSCANTAGLLAL